MTHEKFKFKFKFELLGMNEIIKETYEIFYKN